MMIFGPSLMNLWELRKAALTTTGLVVQVDRSNHNRTTYRYRANGVEYTSSVMGGGYITADTVTVYYSPTRPWIAVLGDPAKAFREDVIGVLLLCAFLTIGPTVVARREMRRRFR
jgi:hypothetical protein